MPFAQAFLQLARRAAAEKEGTTTSMSTLKSGVYLWIGVVDIFLFSVSTLLFVYRGRRTLDINAHAVLLTSIGSFTILVVNTCFLFQFVWPGKFPCFVILWCAYPGVMLWISCTMARAMRLYILSFRNMQKLKERNRAGQMTAAQLYGKGAVPDGGSDDDPALGAAGGGGGGGGAGANAHGGLGDESGAAGADARNLSFWGRRMAGMRAWWAAEMMRMTERRLVWYVLGSTLFSAIVCAIIQGLTRDLAIVPMKFAKCAVGVWEYFPLYSLTALYCLVLTPIIVYHIWPIKDAFGIRHDILISNLFTFVCIVMFMVQTNKGFGGSDPFWDSFLWCALLFNMSQFTSVILPLFRSYRQSDAFTWSENSNRTASKELFYRVLNHPELFEKLKVYSAANFCTEITLFLEEYQVLKANTVRFYNIGEPGFDDDADDNADDDDDGGGGVHRRYHAHHQDDGAGARMDGAGAGSPNLATVGSNAGAWVAAATAGDAGGPSAHAEKEALRVHLNGHAGRHAEVESNPDTIISAGDGAAHRQGSGHSEDQRGSGDQNSSMPLRPGDAAALAGYSMQGAAGASAGPRALLTGSRLGGGLRRVFGRGRGAYHKSEGGDYSVADTSSNAGHAQSNQAALAVGGAAIGNLPERRNSRGEDIMVISHIPPFTPVRYTVLATLMQTPAGMTRQGNIATFRTLPFALRGDYYGFYSTFIADGATLQINVEGRISEAITRNIHSQQYTVDMMDEAHTEVLQLLYDNIFKKFVRIYHRDMASVM
ncbi:hypothetical protein H4R18_000561 [Coemansia javaensis]|uniref:RGS domain-containing protein n=1 Tax=Coemansia javaensis TaxID=2761396 RepID=A0A9W8HJC7_9FUNG|nr:hypothetical protein H4R18_000561 [Coemansia javaensis]